MVEFFVPEQMATAFYQQNLPAEDIDKFSAVLHRNSHFSGQCQLWNGQIDKYGYGLVRVPFAGKRLKLNVHRLAFYLSQSASVKLETSLHVSHLCHNKLCISPNHLSYEPPSVNLSRNCCRLDGECKGHRGYRRCILEAVTISVGPFWFILFQFGL